MFISEEEFRGVIKDYRNAILVFVLGVTITIVLFILDVRETSLISKEKFFQSTKNEFSFLCDKVKLINKKIELLEELNYFSSKSKELSKIFHSDYEYVYYFESYNELDKTRDVIISRNSNNYNFKYFLKKNDNKRNSFFKINKNNLLLIKRKFKQYINVFVIDISHLFDNKDIKIEGSNIYMMRSSDSNNNILVRYAPLDYLNIVPYYKKQEVDLFGVKCKVYFLPSAGRVSKSLSSFSFYILFGGVFWTLVCSFFVYRMTSDERELASVNETLLLNQNILKIFVDHSPVQLAMLDKKNRFAICNMQWKQAMGFDGRSFEGRNLFKLLPGLKNSNFQKHLSNSLKDFSNKSGIEKIVDFLGKSQTWIKYAIVPWKNENNVFSGNIVFIENVTELYEKQIELQNNNSALKATNESLDDMLHIASHDLKEPLRSINLNLEILEEDLPEIFEGDAKKRLGRIKQLSGRLTELITSISSYSKLGKTDIQFKRVNIIDVIDEIKSTLADFLKEHNATIAVESNMPSLHFDPVLIKQVIYNIVVNGIIYNSKKEKFVKIICKDYNDFYRFAIKDNGNGIKKEFYDSVFKMFKRLDKQTRGTGVGLAFVRRIVERYGGSISVKSKLGEGSAFSFTILKELKSYNVR